METAVDVKVKMLYGGTGGDIVSQYVAFTRVYNEQVRMHGRTKEAVLETIRICKDKSVLKEYLERREEEVIDIMMTLFDDEYILKTYVKEKEEDAARAAAKAAEMKMAKETALTLAGMGLPVDQIAKVVKVREGLIKQWLEESMATIAK